MSPQSLPRKQLYTQSQTQQPHQIFVCLSWWTPLSTNTKNKALRPRSRKLLTKIEGSCSYTVSPCSSAFIYTRRSVTNVFSVTLFLCLGLLLDCLSFSLYSSSASLLPTFGLKFSSQFFFLFLLLIIVFLLKLLIVGPPLSHSSPPSTKIEIKLRQENSLVSTWGQ